MHHFCLFHADGYAKIVTGHWELVNTVLYVGFSSSVHCTVFGKQKLVDDINLHLGLCLKPSEVEDRAVSAVSNVDSIIRATKCTKQHRKKHDTEKSRDRDTFLLNLICNRKVYGAFSIVLHPCMHAIMKLSSDGDEFSGQLHFAMILHKPSLLTLSIAALTFQ